MNWKTIFCLSAVALLATACAKTTKKEATEAKPVAKTELKKTNGLTYACLVGKDLRLVQVDKTDKRCEVHYTKFGEKNQVAWAEATPSICSRVKKQIRTNIESKGFKCDADVAKLTQERKTASR